MSVASNGGIGPFTREAFERHKAYFACRAEGHKPQLTIMSANGLRGNVITKCQRCGRYIEVDFSEGAEGV